MIIIKNNRKIFLLVFIIFIAMAIFYEKNNKSSYIKNVDIYNVVKEAFLTNEGYSDKLSKHMSEQVFKTTNMYVYHDLNNPDYKKPLKIDLSLNEKSQNIVDNIGYVKMTYSVSVTDSENNVICGSGDIPITFTVKNINGEWYITEKYEPA